MTQGIVFTFLANFFFSLGALYFAKFSKSMGVMRFNAFKIFVALITFVLASSLMSSGQEVDITDTRLVVPLLGSGIIGLAIGDLFLFKAFVQIGPSRTMILFGLKPLIVGITQWMIWHQLPKISEVISSLFFIVCALLFLFEKVSDHIDWAPSGVWNALMGITLDALGMVMVKDTFIHYAELSSFQANSIRSFGALFVLLLILLFRKKLFIGLPKELKDSPKDQLYLWLSPLVGTFMALSFYLQAIKVSSLVLVTAVGITGPFISALLEMIVEKKKPTRTLFLSLILFVIGTSVQIWT